MKYSITPYKARELMMYWNQFKKYLDDVIIHSHYEEQYVIVFANGLATKVISNDIIKNPSSHTVIPNKDVIDHLGWRAFTFETKKEAVEFAQNLNYDVGVKDSHKKQWEKSMGIIVKLEDLLGAIERHMQDLRIMAAGNLSTVNVIDAPWTTAVEVEEANKFFGYNISIPSLTKGKESTTKKDKPEEPMWSAQAKEIINKLLEEI